MIHGAVNGCLDIVNQPPNYPINRPLGMPQRIELKAFITKSTCFALRFVDLRILYIRVYFLVFGVQSFRLESPHGRYNFHWNNPSDD
jgi:hypothetical protein